MHKMSKVKEYYKVQREHEGIMYRDMKDWSECKKAGGGALTDEMKECYLMRQDRLPKIKVQVVSGTCNAEDKYDNMKRIFSEKRRKKQGV